MPILNFTCDKCKHPFEEIIIKTTDKPVCPICKSEKVTKQFSMSGGSFKLKGKGWYKDGY